MRKLEVYIHIPFCVKKCDYCDFLSMRADENTKREYVNALIREIELSREMMKGYQVQTVFIGGGTPSILDGKLIEKTISSLRESCILLENAEITIECNPGTLSNEKLICYQNAGINRISLGLQSANDNELKSIGRIHNFSQFMDSFKMARTAGFDNINVDLMSALPNQSLESYKNTLEKVIKLSPEHISAYSLIVEEDTPIKKRLDRGEIELTDEDVEREMYYITEQILNENGYNRYEISNYSKSGYECRHNIGYWKRTEYLGFGLGAASLYKDTRYNNADNIEQYTGLLLDGNNSDSEFFYQDDIWDIQEDALQILHGKIQKLTVKDMMEEFMFLGLRMSEGINVNEFKERFNRDFYTVYGEVAEQLKKHGLLETGKENIRLTKKGIDISNYAMSQFLL